MSELGGGVHDKKKGSRTEPSQRQAWREEKLLSHLVASVCLSVSLSCSVCVLTSESLHV